MHTRALSSFCTLGLALMARTYYQTADNVILKGGGDQVATSQMHACIHRRLPRPTRLHPHAKPSPCPAHANLSPLPFHPICRVDAHPSKSRRHIVSRARQPGNLVCTARKPAGSVANVSMRPQANCRWQRRPDLCPPGYRSFDPQSLVLHRR